MPLSTRLELLRMHVSYIKDAIYCNTWMRILLQYSSLSNVKLEFHGIQFYIIIEE